MDLKLNVRTPVRFFSIAQQQMIEVAKALSIDARLIVMDEPTSSLTDREVDVVQPHADPARGVSIVFISHRLEEVRAICDRVTVCAMACWSAHRSLTSPPRTSSA